ncbi:DnaT-like ssDNA-binding domain-containing protein [Azotobacter salinestris]|uniref:DnaT-like ssDNA-binding domain-containing protein n=1 Tax=Azotobacter salinestris TaxID=69964 RepID=UPI0032E015E3
MANQWLRLWHDMPNDPKWRTIARVSGQPIALVQAVYLHLLVDASRNVTRGHVTVTTEDLASALDVTDERVECVLSAMQGRVMEGDRLTGWEARQPLREDLGDPQTGAKSAAQRKREQRERDRQKAAQAACHDKSRSVTPDKDEDTEVKPSLTPVGEDAAPVEPEQEPAQPAHAEPEAPVAGLFPMHLEWVPDQVQLKARAAMAGLPLDLFNREAIAGFVIHHEAKGLAKTEREWLAALVNWVKRDAVQAAARPAAVVNFPGKGQRRANGPNFEDDSWRTMTEYDL